MFRKNTDHLQPDLFELEAPSSEAIRFMIQKTEEYVFYRLIFSKIEEADFACLYCNDNGRPNSPVNCMISALILKERHNWSYSELFKQLHFHLDAEDVVTLIPAEELGSGCLQSPDDEDAIYRRNRGESCGVETAMYEFVCGKPDHKLTVR